MFRVSVRSEWKGDMMVCSGLADSFSRIIGEHVNFTHLPSSVLLNLVALLAITCSRELKPYGKLCLSMVLGSALASTLVVFLS